MDDDDVYPMGEYPPEESLVELMKVSLIDRLYRILLIGKERDAWPFI